jgi:HK97 family phage portal protein
VGLVDSLRGFLSSLDARIIDEHRALTPAQVWGAGLDDWYAGNTAAGVQVTTEAAMRAAVGACVRLIADDISGLPVDFLQRQGDARVPIGTEPSWYERPSTDRWSTWPDHISQVVVSILSDGSAFIPGLPNAIDPEFLDVLDPGTVSVVREQGRKKYRVGIAEYDDATLMHIPWLTMPGKLRGLNPVESSKESTGLELAARTWASSFFANGATIGGLIKTPAGAAMSKESIEALQSTFANRHVGQRKAFAFGILTGGADWVQNTVTPQDAALAPLWRQVLEEAARIYHVPPHLLASQESGASSYASVEHRSIEYVQHAVVHVVRRLESAYSRLLPGSDTFVRFNVNALLRGDIKTRYEAYKLATEMKMAKPSYFAALEDFPPDQAIEGWLETPNNNSPDADPEPEPEAERSLPMPVEDPVPVVIHNHIGERAEPSRDLTVNVHQPDMARAADQVEALAVRAEERAALAEERAIRAEERIAALMATPPTVNVTVPEQPAPVVNVAAAEVRVDVPAPVVNVSTPTVQDIRIVGLPRLNATARKNRDGTTTISEE